MAAVGSAKSTSLRQAYKTRPGAPSVPLTLEEARCPVCSEILLEPVTMPCGHSVCLHCFQRTVKLISLCCPLCRLRVSSWARKQSREKSLVNTELWELVRLSHPERCKRRMEQRDGETADDEIFCAPVPIHKSGLMCQECDKLKIKGGAGEDTEERKKKHPLHRMDDCGMLKHCQYPFCGVSDAENEEPIGKRTRHVSAFVRKTSCLHTSAVQRSRSCTDSEDGRGKNRGHAHPTVPEKANITHSYNAGILLSSENSRSFSAPVFSLDKRHHWRGVHNSSATLGLQTKPERSISPESNDSISEELNHFKPIVCSPCTPPKRLPDGQLLEPTIVKSTPRNLARSLHKSTSYEASPTILQKWKQIEVDRQCIKVISKGTITSPIAEDCLKRSTVKERDIQPCNCVVAKDDLQDHHCMCHASTEQSKNRKEKPVLWNKRRLVFDQCNKEEGTQPAGALTKSTTQTIADTSTPKWDSRFESICKYGPSGVSYQMLDKHVGHCNQGTIDPVNLINEPSTRSCEFNRPTSRRGKKRSHKTKHLEETVQSKISRIHCCNACDRFDDLFVRQINQEKEDRELALKLQRQFDRECQKVDRHKTSRNKYVLRSWASKDVTVEHNTRRSDRISKRNEHFNWSC